MLIKLITIKLIAEFSNRLQENQHQPSKDWFSRAEEGSKQSDRVGFSMVISKSTRFVKLLPIEGDRSSVLQVNDLFGLFIFLSIEVMAQT